MRQRELVTCPSNQKGWFLQLTWLCSRNYSTQLSFCSDLWRIFDLESKHFWQCEGVFSNPKSLVFWKGVSSACLFKLKVKYTQASLVIKCLNSINRHIYLRETLLETIFSTRRQPRRGKFFNNAKPRIHRWLKFIARKLKMSGKDWILQWSHQNTIEESLLSVQRLILRD